MADIGDELIETRKELTKLGALKKWHLWISKHVRFTTRAARDYMSISRLRSKAETGFRELARLGPKALYAVAELPDDLLRRLLADPRLPSPKTGQIVSIFDMSENELVAALRKLRGGKSKGPARMPAPRQTRDDEVRAITADLLDFVPRLKGVRKLAGKLISGTKRDFLDACETVRTEGLHLPAWVTPEKGKRLRG